MYLTDTGHRLASQDYSHRFGLLSRLTTEDSGCFLITESLPGQPENFAATRSLGMWKENHVGLDHASVMYCCTELAQTLYVCMYTRMYVCMYVAMYVCMYVWITL